MLTGCDGFSVLEPFNPHERIRDWVDLRLKVGVGALGDAGHVSELVHEGGPHAVHLHRGGFQYVAGVVLQLLDWLQTLRVLRRGLDRRPS